MIQNYTYMDVADNSARSKSCVFTFSGGTRRRVWIAGDIVVVVVAGHPSGWREEGVMSRAVIVRTTKGPA